MLKAKSILMMSTDTMLLNTRSRILETVGFTVAKARSLEEAERELRTKRIALLLLCHTLSSHECQRAIAAAHEIDPSITTLVLGAMSGPCISKADVVFHQMSSPQALVEMVQTILD